MLGLILFGVGESLLITSSIGVSPWTGLAQGIASKTNWSIGFTSLIVSVIILFLWIPLSQQPGIGTILNAVIIALMIDFSLVLLPYPQTPVWQLLQAAAGVMVVGIGSGIYLTANLGSGVRDGLMTGLQKKTGLPVVWVRIGIEVTVVGIGWYLGGIIGVGTLLFAFGVGPCVALSLLLVRKLL
jgi:uncharacterized membrane protein YczE